MLGLQLHWILVYTLNHPRSSDGLLVLCLSLSACFCVLTWTIQCSNAKSQPQWNAWYLFINFGLEIALQTCRRRQLTDCWTLSSATWWHGSTGPSSVPLHLMTRTETLPYRTASAASIGSTRSCLISASMRQMIVWASLSIRPLQVQCWVIPCEMSRFSETPLSLVLVQFCLVCCPII